MILRKYMSLLGIGSAKVDLILQKETYKAGEPVQGHFLIKGGTIEQQLKRIDCDLVVSDHTSDSEKVLDTTTILTSKCIHSEECNNIPFAFQLPESLPVSTKERSYRFKTMLHFNEGVESKDQDIIRIVE